MASFWQNLAACAGRDPDIFASARRVSEAQAICAGCPVTTECAELGATTRLGTWAGVWRDEPPGPSMTADYLREHGTPNAFDRHLRDGEKPCDRCVIAKRFKWHADQRTRPQSRKCYTYMAGGKRDPA